MELDSLLSALEERANTARTVFMLLDSDAEADAWLRSIDMWRAVDRPTETPNEAVAKVIGAGDELAPDVGGFLGR